MKKLQSSCLQLRRVPYLTSIGQNGKNSCDVDSHFVVNAYVLILPNVIELVKSSHGKKLCLVEYIFARHNQFFVVSVCDQRCNLDT